jgi:hypothetical protein
MPKKRKITPRKSESVHHKPFLESFGYVFLSFLFAIFLYQMGLFHSLIAYTGQLGLIGAFIAGMFFVSIFTAAPAGIVLLALTETIPLLPLALVAGAGAVAGDFFILRAFSLGIDETMMFFPKETGIRRIVRLLRHTKYRFVLTILGALVVASPLPDELGLAMMGVTKMSPIPAMILTFVLNFIGIYLLFLAFAPR